MRCPYCTSEISEEALACSYCTRDLYLFKPLLAKIEALEQRVRDLEVLCPSSVMPASQPVPAAEPELPLTPRQRAAEAVLLWGGPLTLLLLAHLLITVVYDAHVLWLRVVSLLIPLPFGFFLMSRRWHGMAPWGFAAFVMATCAVVGMSAVTSLIDQVSILPQDRREWREFLEYAASVGFSYLTGMLIGRMVWRRRQAVFRIEPMQGLAARLAQLLSTSHENAEKLQTTLKKLRDMGSSLAAAGTTAAAAYTGLQDFLGD